MSVRNKGITSRVFKLSDTNHSGVTTPEPRGAREVSGLAGNNLLFGLTKALPPKKKECSCMTRTPFSILKSTAGADECYMFLQNPNLRRTIT